MIFNIFSVISTLRTALLATGLTIHRNVKPESQTEACMVLTYMPRKKTNYVSINDVIILLYLPKINGTTGRDLETYSLQIMDIVKNIQIQGGVINYNESVEPETSNLDSNYTVTKFQFYTINY